MKPTDKWYKKANEYKIYAKDWYDCCSFTEEDAEAQYMSETFGGEFFFHYTRRNKDGKYNGFAVGKHWQGVMETYYRQDIAEHNFCKADYAKQVALIVENGVLNIDVEYYHSSNLFESIQSSTWFPYIKEIKG